MKKCCVLFILCIFILQASCIASKDTFLDFCEDFSKIHQKSGNLVAEPGGGNMQGDETVIQKAIDENDLWLEYQIDYCGTITVTTYFWNNEPIHDFSFSAKDVLGESLTLSISREIISAEGYWDKVVYTIEATEKEIQYFKIGFPNTKGVATSWAQALGEVCAEKKLSLNYYADISGDRIVSLPKSGEESCSYTAHYFDQAGKQTEQLSLSVAFLPDGVNFDNGVLTVSSSVRENETVLLNATDASGNIVSVLQILLKFLSEGDVNGDDLVDEVDFNLVCEGYLVKAEDIRWNTYRLADINQNGCIDIFDVAFISQKVSVQPE